MSIKHHFHGCQKRRWYVLRLLSGAISSTRLYFTFHRTSFVASERTARFEPAGLCRVECAAADGLLGQHHQLKQPEREDPVMLD